MDKQQELEMWWTLFNRLKSIPNDYRSRNHTTYLNEVKEYIYNLVEDLGLSQKIWNTDESNFIPYKGKTLKEHLSGGSTCCCDTDLVCAIHDKYISEQS